MLEEQLVVFRLQNEEYGLPIHKVKEIIRLVAITKMPNTPEYIEGVINLRGGIIPVIDLKNYFGFFVNEQQAEGRIIIIEIAGKEVGIIVDAVEEVLCISEENIEPPPLQASNMADYVRGVGKLQDRLLILLDLDRFAGVDF
jgi:purine-binding chemotaxis protein CheW